MWVHWDEIMLIPGSRIQFFWWHFWFGGMPWHSNFQSLWFELLLHSYLCKVQASPLAACVGLDIKSLLWGHQMLFRGKRQTQSWGSAHSCTANIFNKYSHQVMRVNFLDFFQRILIKQVNQHFSSYCKRLNHYLITFSIWTAPTHDWWKK